MSLSGRVLGKNVKISGGVEGNTIKIGADEQLLDAGVTPGGGEGGGASAFTELTDAFPSYASRGLEFVRVRSDEGGLETAVSTIPATVMETTIYDLTAVGGDAFDMGNMAEGTDANILTDAERTKLSGIETAADVTDESNVNAAGAVMNLDTTTASMGFVIDEDTFVSNLATKVPTQQSVKTYIDTGLAGKQDSGTYATISDINYANLDANGNVGAAAGKVADGLHAAEHATAGADPLKLDDLATPDDNTDLDVSLTEHGLVPKLPGGTTEYLRSDGTWGTPAGGSANPAGADTQIQYNNAGAFGGDSGFTYNAATDIATLVGGLSTNTITERTAAAGVTIDGILVKDGEIDGRDPSVDGTKLDGIAMAATADGATGDAYATSHEADTTAHTAANIVNVAQGSIASTTVQAAVNELDTEKAPTASPTFTGTVVVPDSSFALPKLADQAQSTVVGRAAASGTGAPVALTPGQVRTVADVYSTSQVDARTSGPINVLDSAYSVVGDGTTDDAVAIQAVIDAAAAAGRAVYFPSGKYKVGTSLVYKVPMFGDTGMSNTGYLEGSQIIGSMTDLTPIIDVPSGTTRWEVSGLYLTGVGAKGIVSGGTTSHYFIRNVTARLLHTGFILDGWVGSITDSYALSCLYKGWEFDNANGVSMRGGETQGCGEAISGSWADQTGNVWSISLDYEPYGLFFWKSDGTIQEVGTEEALIGGLSALYEWHYDSGTTTLSVYATSDPGTLYTDVYVKAVGVHLKGGINFAIYSHPIENDLGSDGFVADEADDIGQIVLDNVWTELNHRPFMFGVDKGERTIDFAVKGVSLRNCHVSPGATGLAKRTVLFDNVHGATINGTFDSSTVIETTALSRGVENTSPLNLVAGDTYAYSIMGYVSDTLSPTLGIDRAQNLCPNPFFKGGLRGFTKRTEFATTTTEETTNVRVAGGSALKVAATSASYPRSTIHLPNQSWLSTHTRGQRVGVSAWVWTPTDYDATTYEPRIGLRYMEASTTERNNLSDPSTVKKAGGTWVHHVAWTDVADVGSNDEFSIYITPTNATASPADGTFYCLLSDVVVTIGNQQLTLAAAGKWDQHPEFPKLDGPFMIGFGTAAPTDSSIPAAVGDKVYDTAVAASGTMGWVCTTAGSPGTWKTFGQVSS